jgi:hypothetical protein
MHIVLKENNLYKCTYLSLDIARCNEDSVPGNSGLLGPPAQQLQQGPPEPGHQHSEANGGFLKHDHS